jgi:hypothetical protein
MNMFIITNYCSTNDAYTLRISDFYTSEKKNGLRNVVTNLYGYYQKCFKEMYVIFGIFSE